MGEVLTITGGTPARNQTAAPLAVDGSEDLRAFMAQALTVMQGMADMVRATNERVGELERQVRMLEKVTPSQATDLNAAIRVRASATCREYRMEGMESQIAAAIRKAVRLTTGARSVREIARCDYKPVKALVEEWEEYTTIKAIKARGGKNGR